MKYYKVVRRIKEHLYSLMYLSLPSSLLVEYQEGAWIKGKFGPVFIFSELHDALFFHSQFPGYMTPSGRATTEVWEVEAENVREWDRCLGLGMLRYWSKGNVIALRLKAFFTGSICVDFGYGAMSVCQQAPSGTMVADSVRLIRRVDK